MELINIFIAAIIIMFTSVFAVFITYKFFKEKIHKNIDYLTSFSAGVFFLTSYHLISESNEIFNNFLKTGLFVILGFFLFWVFTRILPEVHHHHGDKCNKDHRKGWRVLFGDSLHNISDGFILVSAFFVSTEVGIGLTMAILVHEFLQEMSEFFILKSSGFSTKKALFWNFITSSTILLGIFISYYFLHTEKIQAAILAVSAGFFISIIFKDLLPKHDHKRETFKKFLIHLSFLVVGLLTMFSILALVAH